MIFVSATRLHVKYFWNLLAFFRANEAAVKQLVQVKGFIAGAELIDKHRTFWTLTLWDKDSDMKSFRNSGAHQQAMRRLPNWCDEASYVHWTQEAVALPDWQTVQTRMQQEGRHTKVRKPSAKHLAGEIPPIMRTKFQRPLKPATTMNPTKA